MYKFELPINERTRRLISIENIFLRLNNQIKSMVNFSEVGCFESYFNMRATASRADIKIEITQELEKLILKKRQLNKTKKNLDLIKNLSHAKKIWIKYIYLKEIFMVLISFYKKSRLPQ